MSRTVVSALFTLLLALSSFGGLSGLVAVLAAGAVEQCCPHDGGETEPAPAAAPCTPNACDCLGCLTVLLPERLTTTRSAPCHTPPPRPTLGEDRSGYLAAIDYPPEIA